MMVSYGLLIVVGVQLTKVLIYDDVRLNVIFANTKEDEPQYHKPPHKVTTIGEPFYGIVHRKAVMPLKQVIVCHIQHIV
jgi:hypothetical protein